MQLLLYIMISSVCLSICYIAYRLIYVKEVNFRQLRIYLVISIFVSLLIPLSNYSIEIYRDNNHSIMLQEITANQHADSLPVEITAKSGINWPTLFLRLYFIITLALLGRIFLQMAVLTTNYIKSDKIKHKDCVLLLNHRFRNTFSFFKWIYIDPGTTSKEDLEQIIAHERIHASQYHSFDLIVIELLTAVMWFNPMIWMMKNTIQLVHEYLADEGALNSGIDRIKYQTLLINQVTEERLICLSSSFNHSLIKKRMKMITNSNFNRESNLKILALLPLTVSLFLVMACVNGFFSEDLKAGPNLNNVKESLFKNTLYPELAKDTIIKRTITRIENKDNRIDTLETESYDITVPDGSTKTVTIVRKGNPEDFEDLKETELDEDLEIKHIEEIEMEHSTGVNHNSNVTIEASSHKDNQNKVTTITKTEIREVNDINNSKILYVIDGVPHLEDNPLSNLDPKIIKSIDVIKDQNIKKYTDEDYDGVIIIKTTAVK